MSTGKYSPILPHYNECRQNVFKYNCYGETPEPWNQQIRESGIPFNSLTMFADYDNEGFDSYGYSVFDAEGNFVGHGCGVDRCGYTELDYLSDAAEGGNLYYDIQTWDTLQTFLRNRETK